jgi:hypothetical protein
MFQMVDRVVFRSKPVRRIRCLHFSDSKSACIASCTVHTHASLVCLSDDDNRRMAKSELHTIIGYVARQVLGVMGGDRALVLAAR